MPNHLDLTLSPTRANMLLSPSNATGPRMTLRRNGPLTDQGPQSASSSRLSFTHLLASPPPSPGLPALVPRHGKPPPTPTPRRVRRMGRLILWLAGVATILYYASALLRAHRHLPAMGWSTDSGEDYELVGDDSLPDFATLVVVTDSRGRTRWTVSIPPTSPFPLAPQDYAELCAQTLEISGHVADLLSQKHITHAAHFPYYHTDPNFLDAVDAERAGLLLSASQAAGLTWRSSRSSTRPLLGEPPSSAFFPPCERSLTITLETPSAGLAPTLMLLWTAYGLAQSENRAFFIDDSRWSYGAYTDFFLPPPQATCRPPPRHQILPCPHSTRHLLVSSATAAHTFGGAFHDHFEDAHKSGTARQRPIFALARKGYEALFRLPPEDAAHVSSRLAELKALTTSPSSSSPSSENHDEANGAVIAAHVRHGDAHPLEFQYRASYIPLDRYTTAARSTLRRLFPGPLGSAARSRSVLVLASDDPDVYDAEEFSHALRAQSVIRLASRPAAPGGDEREGMFRRFTEAPIGWEGGFWAGMYWSLGGSNLVEQKRLRGLVGRAYILDLAVLGGNATRGVVCGVGGMGCKILAVMVGWEMVESGRWVNVDGEFGWRGVSW